MVLESQRKGLFYEPLSVVGPKKLDPKVQGLQLKLTREVGVGPTLVNLNVFSKAFVVEGHCRDEQR